ncbi:hypothetical protein NDU88_002402 [Pleurodeles waltl]|uniref:Uncharacterized protein n=1 Tax=Pleurodeles waltl TaxID=8319 RepID=A0AAV7RBR5_PLEWA|nr:hypothetical protein NDU88_002402 [Pleurodeles waltl]
MRSAGPGHSPWILHGRRRGGGAPSRLVARDRPRDSRRSPERPAVPPERASSLDSEVRPRLLMSSPLGGPQRRPPGDRPGRRPPGPLVHHPRITCSSPSVGAGNPGGSVPQVMGAAASHSSQPPCFCLHSARVSLVRVGPSVAHSAGSPGSRTVNGSQQVRRG